MLIGDANRLVLWLALILCLPMLNTKRLFGVFPNWSIAKSTKRSNKVGLLIGVSGLSSVATESVASASGMIILVGDLVRILNGVIGRNGGGGGGSTALAAVTIRSSSELSSSVKLGITKAVDLGSGLNWPSSMCLRFGFPEDGGLVETDDGHDPISGLVIAGLVKGLGKDIFGPGEAKSGGRHIVGLDNVRPRFLLSSSEQLIWLCIAIKNIKVAIFSIWFPSVSKKYLTRFLLKKLTFLTKIDH